MRFLADMGVSMSTVETQRDAGHDAVHLRDEGLQRLPDSDILDKARQSRRVVLAFDLGFGELLAAGLHDTPSVVIFRLRNPTPAFVTLRLLHTIDRHGADLEAGAVVIVEDARNRVRRLPIRGPRP